jgi:hypothetical protein
MEGVTSGVGRRERMKGDSGIKDRDERSRGIEILMTDAFAKSKPTEPFRLSLMRLPKHTKNLD